MGLQIIGAGWGRTGTDSLRKALIHLGFGPCHHMYELVDHADQAATWRTAFETGRFDFDALFAGYTAQVDWPGAHFWRETAALYPKARVILSVRDPRSWYRSMQATILAFLEQESYDRPQSHDTAYITRQILRDICASEASAVAAFSAHTAEVIATISPERLLVYELGSGWEPLCDFLGKPMPDTPYPTGNTADEFHAR